MSIMFDLRESLLKEHSKAQCAVIVDWIGHSQQRFDSLFNLFLNDDYRVVQRASWPLSYSVLAHPELIKKHFTKLLDNLRNPEFIVPLNEIPFGYCRILRSRKGFMAGLWTFVLVI